MMKKTLVAMSLACGLLMPVGLNAQDRDDHEHHDRRVYDRDHRDYHEWNANEDRAYRRYWEERRHAYIDWDRTTEEQQSRYWRWRHDHPDSVLFQMNVR